MPEKKFLKNEKLNEGIQRMIFFRDIGKRRINGLRGLFGQRSEKI